jgi:hypothetical protein
MAGDRKRAQPIAKLLAAAALDLDAARRLPVDPPNVLAANHLQQAAEKSPAPAIADLREMLATVSSLHELAHTELLAE